MIRTFGLLTLVTVSVAARGEPVSFRTQVQPVFDANCVACHQEAGAQAGLVLEDGRAYTMVVGRPSTELSMALVVPGDPDKSYLMQKLTSDTEHPTRSGARMPLGGALSLKEIMLIRQWILEGAVNN